MKPTKKKPAKRRLKEVLGNKPFDKIKWDMIFGKLKKLATAIEMYKGGSMSIDDVEYRWVDDRINYLESEGKVLNKDDMERANDLWTSYVIHHRSSSLAHMLH